MSNTSLFLPITSIPIVANGSFFSPSVSNAGKSPTHAAPLYVDSKSCDKLPSELPSSPRTFKSNLPIARPICAPVTSFDITPLESKSGESFVTPAFSDAFQLITENKEPISIIASIGSQLFNDIGADCNPVGCVFNGILIKSDTSHTPVIALPFGWNEMISLSKSNSTSKRCKKSKPKSPPTTGGNPVACKSVTTASSSGISTGPNEGFLITTFCRIVSPIAPKPFNAAPSSANFPIIFLNSGDTNATVAPVSIKKSQNCSPLSSSVFMLNVTTQYPARGFPGTPATLRKGTRTDS
mmetsp:Transcript_8242/g.24246  ORF Transcript_8242/g.24246 Transcript_8242/m.24246 type:complete len:296 (-) Transcript_8242:364-1251(-)